MDIITILQQIRGTGDIGAIPTDGMYHDLTIKTTEDDGVTARVGAGIYGSVKDMYTGILPIVQNMAAMLSIVGISTEIVSLYTDKATLDSIYADKAKLDSIFSDKATLDSLVADKSVLDSLYADKIVLDRIYASIAEIDRVYLSADNIDSFVERYFGALAVAPTVISHPNLIQGSLYFDTVLLEMRVYDGASWSEGVLSETSISTLTNKTINDLSNYIHSNATHFSVEALESLAVGDVIEVDNLNDAILKVRKQTSLQNPVIGVIESPILIGATGSAVSGGMFSGLPNTESWVVGDTLYPNGLGGLTKTPSISSVNYNRAIGYVVRANVTDVTIAISMSHGNDVASRIGYDGTSSGLVATTTQGAIDEVDARLDTAETKLAGIEPGATADQTASEIETLYESTLDTNKYTDAEKAKLLGIEPGSTADQIASEVPSTPAGNVVATNVQAAINELDTEKQALSEKGVANGYAPLDGATLIPAQYLPSYVDDVLEVATYSALPATGALGVIYIVVADETSGNNTSSYRWTGTVYAMVSNTLTAADIKALYEANADTNAFTDANLSKLNGIEANATADQTASEIKIAYESNLDTNAFDDAYKTKLTNIDIDIQTVAVANAIAMAIALG